MPVLSDTPITRVSLPVVAADQAVQRSPLVPPSLKAEYQAMCGRVLRALVGIDGLPLDDSILRDMRAELRRLEEAGDDVHADHLREALERYQGGGA